MNVALKSRCHKTARDWGLTMSNYWKQFEARADRENLHFVAKSWQRTAASCGIVNRIVLSRSYGNIAVSVLSLSLFRIAVLVEYNNNMVSVGILATGKLWRHAGYRFCSLLWEGNTGASDLGAPPRSVSVLKRMCSSSQVRNRNNLQFREEYHFLLFNDHSKWPAVTTWLRPGSDE